MLLRVWTQIRSTSHLFSPSPISTVYCQTFLITFEFGPGVVFVRVCQWSGKKEGISFCLNCSATFSKEIRLVSSGLHFKCGRSKLPAVECILSILSNYYSFFTLFLLKGQQVKYTNPNHQKIVQKLQELVLYKPPIV